MYMLLFVLQLLLSGLFFPFTATSLGLVNLVGRQLYPSGYTAKEANGRVFGHTLMSISQVSLCFMGIFGGLTIPSIRWSSW
jgi:hypothetical protein